VEAAQRNQSGGAEENFNQTLKGGQFISHRKTKILSNKSTQKQVRKERIPRGYFHSRGILGALIEDWKNEKR